MLIHINDLLNDVKKNLGQTDKQTDRQTDRHTGSDVEKLKKRGGKIRRKRDKNDENSGHYVIASS